MNRLHMMPVPSLNDIASSMKPGNRRLHTVPNTHNHLLPHNSSWTKKNVATAVSRLPRENTSAIAWHDWMTMTRQAVQHCRYIQCLRVCHSILVTLQRIFRAEPSAALHATDGILEILYDDAPFANSAAVCDQPRLSEWLQI